MKGGSGARRHIIMFQVKTEALDDVGELIETWADSFEEYAAFEPLGSREFPIAHKRHANTTARFRILYRGGINPDKNRIAFQFDPDASPPLTSIWNIHGDLPADGKFVEVHIEASEIK